MKRKINILIPVFILLILVYVVRSFFGSHVRIETLRQSTLEDATNAKAVLVKYESVLNTGATGVFENLVQEGARVAVGQEVAAIYSGTVDPNLKNRLEQVNKKIEQIEKNQKDLFSFTADVSRIEQNIAGRTAELIQSSQSGDLAKVGEIKFVLEALCAKKAQITGGGTGADTLSDLKSQKASLEHQIGTAEHRIQAPAAGVFSVEVDGLEELVTPYNMMELTPQKTKELLDQETKRANKEISACKVIRNFRYFLAVNLPAQTLEDMRIDDSAYVRLYDYSGDLIDTKILYISPEEEGEKTVILELDRHLDSLLRRRHVNIEFVKKRYNGYRISVNSLRTEDNVNGIYVRRENMPWFVPVNILYNTDEIAIVESKDASNPLRLYDEVIVNAG